MSLEAVKQVTQAEEQGRAQKAQATQDAKRLISEAEKAGRQAVLDAQTKAEAEIRRMIAEAEQSASGDTVQIRKASAADADKLRKQAEGRLEEAASLIVRKVVDA